MDKYDLNELLDKLIVNWENETVEFKAASTDYSTDDIGKYFSALANEARLSEIEEAWLVFGVNDKTRQITGSDYRLNTKQTLDDLKFQIFQSTNPKSTFKNIYEFDYRQTNKRIILFRIPPCPKHSPIAWKGHYYGRSGQSLGALSLDKLDQLRALNNEDWSAQIVPNATVNDLDSKALKKARENFIQKNLNRLSQSEMEKWDDLTFLDKAKITQNSKITHTALLLLGKSESSYLLSPHPAQITWKLDSDEKAYEHFSPPFLLATTSLYRKIRNFQLRLLPQDELLAREISKYDQHIILEALHNCIAHQDYSRNERILVTEKRDRLILENAGSFFEGNPNDYIQGNKTPRRYRNHHLAQALANLNMIDTMGYGIHTIHQRQAKRYLPMPDYILDTDSVSLTIYGDIVDESYSKLLISNTNLELTDILALDRIQKNLPIDSSIAKKLKKARLIEGRKPRYLVSFYPEGTKIADKVTYIHSKSQSDEFYKKLLLDYLKKFKQATRLEINQLLLPKINDLLDDKQKGQYISNLLTKFNRQGIIENQGSRTKPKWVIKNV